MSSSAISRLSGSAYRCRMASALATGSWASTCSMASRVLEGKARTALRSRRLGSALMRVALAQGSLLMPTPKAHKSKRVAPSANARSSWHDASMAARQCPLPSTNPEDDRWLCDIGWLGWRPGPLGEANPDGCVNDAVLECNYCGAARCEEHRDLPHPDCEELMYGPFTVTGISGTPLVIHGPNA